MLLEHERNYCLGMDALITVCSWNANEIVVWAWMLWSTYALGTRTELLLGHGSSSHRELLEHERNYGLGMDALVTVCSWKANGIMAWAWMLQPPRALRTRTELWLGHGCSGHRIFWEQTAPCKPKPYKCMCVNQALRGRRALERRRSAPTHSSYRLS